MLYALKRRRWDSNPRPLSESLVFKTSSLNHSDTSPKQCFNSLTGLSMLVKHFLSFPRYSSLFFLLNSDSYHIIPLLICQLFFPTFFHFLLRFFYIQNMPYRAELDGARPCEALMYGMPCGHSISLQNQPQNPDL